MALGGAPRVRTVPEPAAAPRGAAGAGDAPAFPRVLVVAGTPFTRRHNNGLFKSDLFEGWPADRLAQLYEPSLTPVEPMFDVCRRFWRLTPWGVRPGPAPAAGGDGSGAQEAAAREEQAMAARQRVIRASRPAAVQRAWMPVREWLYGRPSLLSGRALEELRGFRPDLLFSTLGSLSMLRASLRLRDALGVPLVPFVTDDWVSTLFAGAIGEARLRREMRAAFQEVLDGAPVRMVISPTMVTEYARRYGGEFLWLPRPVDPAPYAASPPRDPAGRTLELVYAGQVAAGRWRMLRRIGEALRLLADEGIHARLRVYTTPMHAALHGADLTLPPVMEMMGHVANARLPAVYDGADVLVHAESFEPEWVAYTRLSLSTKLAEYLVAGRAVLGFGPAEVGAMCHLSGSGGAVVVGEDSDEALVSALRSLLADAATREALGREGRRYALEAHGAARLRERLRAELARAAWGPAEGRAG